MKGNEKTNPNYFGEGDRNLPNCECRLIYERIRNAEKPARSPQEDLLSARTEQSGPLQRTDDPDAAVAGVLESNEHKSKTFTSKRMLAAWERLKSEGWF